MDRDISVVVARISHDLLPADIQAHERRMTGDVAPDFSEEICASAIPG
jgi:hypothetical protein